MELITNIITNAVWWYVILMTFPLIILIFTAKFWVKKEKFQYTVAGLLLSYIVANLLAILLVYLTVFPWWFMFEPSGLQLILNIYWSLALLVGGLMQLILKKECKLARNMILIPVIAGMFYQIQMITFSKFWSSVIFGIIFDIIFITAEIFAIVLWIKYLKKTKEN